LIVAKKRNIVGSGSSNTDIEPCSESKVVGSRDKETVKRRGVIVAIKIQAFVNFAIDPDRSRITNGKIGMIQRSS